MKTRLVLLMVLFLCFVVPTAGLTASPEISDLKVSGAEGTKKDETRKLTITFKSDVPPDDIALQYYAQLVSYRTASTFRKDFSWKKGDFEASIEKKGGLYEITARREFQAPRWHGTVDVSVWITAGGTESNKLKVGIPVE